MIHVLQSALLIAAMSNPVQVHSCVVVPSTFVSENQLGGGERIDSVRVQFVNLGATPLDAVTFVVHYNGSTQTVTDRGHFAPGATIDHHLSVFELEPYAHAGATCDVSEVQP
jgi:hypothetical protein